MTQACASSRLGWRPAHWCWYTLSEWRSKRFYLVAMGTQRQSDEHKATNSLSIASGNGQWARHYAGTTRMVKNVSYYRKRSPTQIVECKSGKTKPSPHSPTHQTPSQNQHHPNWKYQITIPSVRRCSDIDIAGSSLYLGALYFDHCYPPEQGYGYVGYMGLNSIRFLNAPNE